MEREQDGGIMTLREPGNFIPTGKRFLPWSPLCGEEAPDLMPPEEEEDGPDLPVLP